MHACEERKSDHVVYLQVRFPYQKIEVRRRYIVLRMYLVPANKSFMIINVMM